MQIYVSVFFLQDENKETEMGWVCTWCWRNAYPSFGELERIPVGEKSSIMAGVCCRGGLIHSREAAHVALTGKKLENPVEKEILMENLVKKKKKKNRSECC